MAKAPKKFHSEATRDIYNLLKEIIKDNHKALNETEFLILFKHGGWDSKGRRILGKAKVIGEDMRSTFGRDAIIYLNKDAWWMLSDAQKRYLLDHELCHLDITKDKNYDTILAADGRPKLTTVPHDLEDFVAVVKRHGIIMEDVKRFVKVISDAKQITIDDVVEGQTGIQPPQGELVEADPNQATIDEVMANIEDAPPSNVTSLTGKQTKKQKEEAAKLAAEADKEVEKLAVEFVNNVAVNEAPLPFSDDPDDLPL